MNSKTQPSTQLILLNCGFYWLLDREKKIISTKIILILALVLFSFSKTQQAHAASITFAKDTTLTESTTITSGDTWTINEGVTLTISQGITLAVKEEGSIINDGTIRNNGTIQNAGQGFIDNSFRGMINNHNGGTFNNSGFINNEGDIFNSGAITNDSSGLIDNFSGTINNNNNGTITNSGRIASEGTFINNGGIVVNSGRIFNEGTINNFIGLIDNSGTINTEVGSINNSDTINNSGTIGTSEGFFFNSGTINNAESGLINNGFNGTINNTGTINNDGTIDNCPEGESGMITGPINGNPPIECQGDTPSLGFTPVADATIKFNKSTENFGTDREVETDNSPIQDFLIKFDISGIGTRHVQSAKLRLFCTNKSNKGGDFHLVDNDWSEDIVTWDNAPPEDPEAIASLGPVVRLTWVEVDLTSLITEDGVYSLRVMSPSRDGADYRSKEKPGLEPELILMLE